MENKNYKKGFEAGIKEGARNGMIVLIIIIIIIILLVWVITSMIVNNQNANDKDVEVTINYSEISDNYDLESITYKAVDYGGNQIIGKNYYGVYGIYTQEKPLIQGENYYTYWVKNDSYYVEPTELIVDETHRNQSMIAKAYKKVNLSDDINVIDRNNYHPYNEISFVKYDEHFDIAEFEIRYQSEERTRFPFGALIIFEYDGNISDLICEGVHWKVPDFYTMNSVNNDVDAFEIEKDEGGWERIEIHCIMEKYYEKTLSNNKIKLTIFPNDFFLGDWDFKEEYGLELGVEDYLMNPLNKPIFEGEIVIKP